VNNARNHAGLKLLTAHETKQKLPVLDGAEFFDTRKYGKATVHIWRVG
jgi:hypothetical protein